MVELQHGLEPVELAQYRTSYPQAGPKEFNEEPFASAKRAVRTSLHRDQGGLCVYCECQLQPSGGQVDHIKPKGGKNAHAHLSFVYENYAYSCINNKTCGQNKGETLLPVEPGPGCNAEWTLSTDGTIEPVLGLSKKRKHEVTQTCKILGLNKDAALVDERKRWLRQGLEIAQKLPADLVAFINAAPYRHMLNTVL